MTPWAAEMNRRQDAGLCRVCQAPQVPGKTLCERHLKEQAERTKTKRDRLLKSGRCINCQQKTYRKPMCSRCHNHYLKYQASYYHKTLKPKRRKS